MEIKEVRQYRNSSIVIARPDSEDGVFATPPYNGQTPPVGQMATRFAGNKIVIVGIEDPEHLERLRSGDTEVLTENGYMASDTERPGVTVFSNCEAWLRQDNTHICHIGNGVIEYSLAANQSPTPSATAIQA